MAVVQREDAERGEDVSHLGAKLVGRGEEAIGDVGDEIGVRKNLVEADLREKDQRDRAGRARRAKDKRTSVFMRTRRHLTHSICTVSSSSV